MLESLSNNIFTYKKLSPEEQTARGILGRLVGIIADTNNATRNGRKYGLQLWQNVFDDPIMKEKITNRCCFGEIGHPLDGREEVDPEKIAICLAEQPKLGKDGNLYGVFDILNTPCGKILKALCDYGTNIGISSRGSGDIMDNDEVDPDTYNCECWDAVIIPAIKAARLVAVNESLDTNSIKLRKALTESYNAASEEDKIIMKETLENLNIQLDEECAKKQLKEVKLEEDDEVEEEVVAEDEAIEAEQEEAEESEEDEAKEEDSEDEDSEEEKEDVEEADEEIDEVEDEEENEDETTVKQLLAALKEFDKKAKVEFAPIKINGVEYKIDLMNLSHDDSGKVVINIGYSPEQVEEEPAEQDIIDVEQVPEIEDVQDDNIDDENAEVEVSQDDDVLVDDEDGFILEEPAEDDELEDEEIQDADQEIHEPVDDVKEHEDEVMESLKECIRQKDAAEKAMTVLKEEKTVSDTKVAELQEELGKYKSAYARLSELAAKAKKLEADNKALSEELVQKDKKIDELKTNTKLTESLNAEANKVKALTESFNEKQKEFEEIKANLTSKNSKLTEQLAMSNKVANNYKAKLQETLKHYVDSKASMLGVRPTDITNRLNESFSLKDIDAVCSELLTKNVNINKMPLEFNNKSRIKFNEGKEATKNKYVDPANGYDIDDSLLELAGLK